MALVERYLNAVKFWLPRDQKEDIIAELGADLNAQIEEKESELGHTLSDADVEAILRRCGSPMVVAERYLPQRYLIGPAIFPIYRVVIRSLIFYFLLPWLLVWLGLALFSPGFRAAHGGGQLFASLNPWWLAVTYSLFFCTLAFALVERSQFRTQMVTSWNPRSLPALRDPNKISRGGTIVELTASVASLAIWFELGAFRRQFELIGVTVTLSHWWPYFFWALAIFGMAGIGLACLNLMNPRWTQFSASLKLGLDCYMWALAYLICRANIFESLSGGELSPLRGAHVVATLDWMLRNWAVWVAVIGLVAVAFDVRRIVRVGAERFTK